ncbi:MAG: hypothetical protein ACOZB3_09760 [Calditrichota bacterium]
MTFQRFIFLSGIIILLFSGCTQRETDAGIQAITGLPDDQFAVVSGTPTVSASWIPEYTNGASQSLQVGNANGLYAYTAVRFNVASILPDSFTLDSFPSMQVRFQRNRVWPADANTDLRLVMREITESWTEADLIPGSLPDYENYPIIDSGLTINAVDSTVKFTIPRDLWTRWIEEDTTTYGLLFEPRWEGLMLEWYSSEFISTTYPDYPPTLLFNNFQVWRSTDSAWVDSTFSVAAAHDAFLVKDGAPHDPGRIYVSQGLPGRAVLYFPVDTLYAQFSRSVVRAELQIFADSLNPATFQFVAGQNILFKDGSILDTSWIAKRDSTGFLAADDIESWYENSSSGMWDNTNRKFVLDVTGIVKDWVADPSSNAGVQILTSGASSYLNRNVFHSGLSDSVSLRPRLYIWYTESQY